MITIICLIILFSLISGSPVGGLVGKLKGVDWKNLAQTAWEKIVLYSKKGGRTATRPLLLFYYTLTEGDLSSMEKAMVYAGIIYLAVPFDILPRSVLNWIGVIDDIAVAAWVFNKLDNAITPSIELKADDVLDDWFGKEEYIDWCRY